MKPLWILLPLVGCLFLAATPGAVAEMITHNGLVVASDDFEDDTLLGPPTSPPWTGKNGGAIPTNTMFVDDAVGGAFGSTKYLTLDRADNAKQDGQDAGRGEINFGPFSAGTVGASLMVYVPSTNEVSVTHAAEGTIGLGTGLVSELAFTLGGYDFGGQFNIDYYDWGGGGWTDTGVDYQYDTWQRWDMTLDLATGDATLQVGPSGVADFNVGKTGMTANQMEFEGGWAGTNGPPHNKIYVDAVPEPSTLVGLLGLAIAGLGFYVRRGR